MLSETFVAYPERLRKSLFGKFFDKALSKREEPQSWLAKAYSPVSGKPKSALAICLSLLLLDASALLLSGTVATAVCAVYGSECSGQDLTFAFLVATAVALLGFLQAGYSLKRRRRASLQTMAILTASLLGGAAGLLCLMFEGANLDIVRLWPSVWVPLTVLLSAISALVSSLWLKHLSRAGLLGCHVAVVGDSPRGLAVATRVAQEANQFLRVTGFYDEAPGENGKTTLRCAGKLKDLAEQAHVNRLKAIVLAIPLSEPELLRRACSALRCVTCDIYLAVDPLDMSSKSGSLERLGTQAVIKIAGPPLDEWQLLQKACLDRVLALIMLVIMMPLLVIIAIAIKVDSRGPVLFRQPRQGLNGELFNMFKFRTMFDHMEDLHAEVQTVPGDPRITRVGRLLRKTSLDELPQLLNVIRGDMSLVGPRPHALGTKAAGQLFAKVVTDYPMRHRVKPGITGWAQVNGWRGETRTREQLGQRVAHDLHYIDNWSLLLDLKILVLTVCRELNSKVAF